MRELERARRDLEGRCCSDIAATTAELEQERIRRQELEKFLAVLNRNHTEFQQLGDSGDPDFARKLERLRGEYFQAAGRVSAFELRRNSGGGIGRLTPTPNASAADVRSASSDDRADRRGADRRRRTADHLPVEPLPARASSVKRSPRSL